MQIAETWFSQRDCGEGVTLIYDRELYDFLHHSCIPDILATMDRLRALPVETVHDGHYPSFGRDRLHQLIDDYVAGKRSSDCPARAPSPKAH